MLGESPVVAATVLHQVATGSEEGGVELSWRAERCVAITARMFGLERRESKAGRAVAVSESLACVSDSLC